MGILSLSNLVAEFLLAFSALLSIINPFGMAFVLFDRTRFLTVEERRKLSRQVAINSLIVLLVTFFLGTAILGFFGISLQALRLAGGFVVAFSGWTMLNAPTQPAEKRIESVSTGDVTQMAFFPLTIPLTTGPGSIATAIALNASRSREWRDAIESAVVSVTVSVAVAIVVYVVYSRAELLARVLGPEGTNVVTRLSAFLLLCIGVQIMMTGISEYLTSLPGLG
ncbi:MarC family protein [Cupriavidus gilardii]|uniref:UPF0056 membrane protein n=1 Tax=Cupriavidus gilardii TaxID=82541 RepID=A0ABY4VPK9_9BURK|nr:MULTISPECIES: MarC family protein [Cupriavidus]ALD93405.1 multiple antibiotic resistance protein [Cupriavidus gilardii CR3]QQE08782.1 MarC family protein [Cupriavidus sp. ISTL7]ESH93168.1 antibiotic resistance protein [Cupriavidus sp. HPC(L)]MCD9119659.1 MarC family protein [Cupriavidus sp. UGS-1]MCT9013349.1 MarC family protein [Cupriavidus gilardii]